MDDIAADIADAKTKLDKEFASVKDSLGDLYVAIEALKAARAEDDIESLLGAIEDAAKKARTGGVLGSGAKSHSRALKDYVELTTPSES